MRRCKQIEKREIYVQAPLRQENYFATNELENKNNNNNKTYLNDPFGHK